MGVGNGGNADSKILFAHGCGAALYTFTRGESGVHMTIGTFTSYVKLREIDVHPGSPTVIISARKPPKMLKHLCCTNEKPFGICPPLHICKKDQKKSVKQKY
jgi:hypothetical protein